MRPPTRASPCASPRTTSSISTTGPANEAPSSSRAIGTFSVLPRVEIEKRQDKAAPDQHAAQQDSQCRDKRRQKEERHGTGQEDQDAGNANAEPLRSGHQNSRVAPGCAPLQARSSGNYFMLKGG